MSELEQLEQRVARIEARNKRVEYDKAWEVSITRRAILATLTYLVVAAFLVIIHKDNPFVNALVPAIGFLLSTPVVRFAKQRWIKRQEHK